MRLAPLSAETVFNRFGCGRVPLDRFLKNKARKSCERREHAVHVAYAGDSWNCIGYYALQLGSDTVPAWSREKAKYLQNYTAFPAVHLSYLAVHEEVQHQGLGKYLLMDVFDRVASISEHAGLYALTLQSYDEDSTAFYRSLGFEEYSEGGAQPKMLYPLENILRLVRGD